MSNLEGLELTRVDGAEVHETHCVQTSMPIGHYPTLGQVLLAGTWCNVQIRHLSERGILALYDHPHQMAFRPGDHILLSGKFSAHKSLEQVWCQIRTVSPMHRKLDGSDVGILGLTFLESDPITHRLRSNHGLLPHHTLVVRLGSAAAIEISNHSRVIEVDSCENALSALEEYEMATVLILADGDRTPTQHEWTALRWTFPAQFSNLIVISSKIPELSSSSLFFRACQRLNASDLHQLINAAHTAYENSMTARLDGGLRFMLQSENLTKVQAVTSKLAIQRDINEAIRFVTHSIKELTHSSNASCLLISRFDSTATCVASHINVTNQDVETGITGYVLATRKAIHLDRIATSRCYETQTDLHLGNPNDRAIVHPILADSDSMGLIAVSRSRNDPPFGEQEVQIVALAADLFASSLLALNLRASFAKACQQDRSKQLGIYREEALNHHAKSILSEGSVLPFSPFWEKWAFGSVALLILAGVVFAIFGRIGEYAAGPAIVQADQATSVSTVRVGTIASVEVKPGQQVTQGQVLFRIASQEQNDQLQNIEEGWRAHLVSRMLDPTDTGAQQALRQIRIERDALLQALRMNDVRAPHDGIVGDLRIHSGELLQVGQTALLLTRSQPTYSLVAFLPGRFAPQITVDQPFRFKLRGYQDQYMELVVERLSQGVVSPTDARRVIGFEAQDMFQIEGPVVLVYARVETATIQVEGQSLSLLNGMIGDAEFKLRSQSILSSMLPALKKSVGVEHE